LLQRDGEVREVAGIVGPEALEDRDRLVLAAASSLRELVLGQSAFDPNDAFSPPAKTFVLVDAAIGAFDIGADALARGNTFAGISLEQVRRALADLRDAPVAQSEAAQARVKEALEAMVLASSRTQDAGESPA
jgi:V/A-type H+-transporting ATPase subunit A